MIEGSFWRSLRKRLPPGHWSRVENPADPGTPDLSFCTGGLEGFLELKYRPTYPSDSLPLLGDRYGLRPTQLLWIPDRIDAGGRVGILAGVGRDLYMVPGSWAPWVNLLTRPDFPPPVRWTGPDFQVQLVRFLRRVRHLPLPPGISQES